MKLLSILTLLSLFSVNAYAEKCEGVNACVDLYTKLTGKTLSIDKSISDEMTLAAPDTDLTKENAKVEFAKFCNKNVLSIKGKKIIAQRSGVFLTAPIYVVSENNIPMMINKDGPVTLVYHAKGNIEKLAARTRTMTSKKNKFIQFTENKIIVVFDTYEKAEKIAREWVKLDK